MDQIGKYRVIRELGRGGFGAVYLCEDSLGDRLAVKIFQPKDDNVANAATSASGDAGAVLRERFISEARALRQLSNNPYIVDLYDFDETEDGVAYYVMPFLERSLVDEIGKDIFTAQGQASLDPELLPRRLPLERSIRILREILEAMIAVHRAGLVHRDLKPANILFDRAGPDGKVQVCDFGIAKLPESDYSQSGIAMGSVKYMSPEQRESAKGVDARSDVYAIGVLAFRMLTGAMPEGFAKPVEFVPNMGQALSDLIVQAISQDAAKRPADASEFLRLLNQALSNNNTDPADEEDYSGTWVDGADEMVEVGLPSELKPLRDRIEQLLRSQGEITDKDMITLNAMAAVGGLEEAHLETLIERVADETDGIRPLMRFVSFLNSRIESGQLNDHDWDALTAAGQQVGWERDTIEAAVRQKAPSLLPEPEKKAPPRKPTEKTGKSTKVKKAAPPGTSKKTSHRKPASPSPDTVKKTEPPEVIRSLDAPPDLLATIDHFIAEEDFDFGHFYETGEPFGWEVPWIDELVMERTPADKWHHIADRFPDHSPGEFERAAAETNREQLMRRIGEYRDGNATLTSVFELGADLGIPDADIQVITGRKPPRWDREAYLETSEGAAGTAGDIPRGTLYGETDSNRLMRIVREYLDGDSQYDLVAIWVYGAEQGWSDAQLEKMLGAKPDRWNRSQHIREKKPAQKKNPSSGSSRKPTAKPKPSQKRAPKPASTPAPRVATSTADRWLGFLPWSLFVDPTPQDGYWLINRWADLIVIAIAAAIIYVSATSPDGGLVGGSVIAAIFTGIGLLLLREFEEQLPPYVIGLATVLFLVIFGVSTSEGFNGNNVIPDRNQLLIYIIAGLVPLVGLRFWLSPFKGTGVSFTSLLAIAAIIGLGCYFSMPAWPEASMEGFVQFLTAEAAT